MKPQQPRTVLVVDDDFGILDALRDLLEDIGWTVLTATSGGAALRLLRDDGCMPSVIISDVMMPGVNGPDLLRQVQAMPRLRQVPFIEMTAGHRQMSHGATAFLPKPFSLADVTDALELAVADPGDRMKSGAA